VLAETAPPDRSQTAVPISVELAKKRHALTIKAHPTKPAGSKNGAYAQAQRDYFQDCIAKAATCRSEPARTAVTRGGLHMSIGSNNNLNREAPQWMRDMFEELKNMGYFLTQTS